MKLKRRSSDMDWMSGLFAVFVLAAFLLVPISWIGNMYKLTGCDFKEDYRCEVLHGIGVIPVVSPFTVWVSSDRSKEKSDD